jgi:serine/threonine protein kinase
VQAVTPGSLQKGQILADRYRIDEPLPDALGERGFCGTDTKTDDRVRLLWINADTAERVGKAIAVTHPHLARLEAVVKGDEGTALLVEQYVGGTALTDRLRASGPQAPVDTVKNALRIADALTALHALDSAHGELVPAAILLEPERHPEPTLRHLGLMRVPDGYSRPERGDQEPWDIADDAWSVAALLYEMLTGRAPPADGLETADPSLEVAVADPELREVLGSYLTRNPGDRRATLGHFKRVLARWYAEHAAEEAVAASAQPHHEPPPLPTTGAPARLPTRESRAPSPSLRRRILVLVVALTAVGLLVGLAAAWTYSAIDRRAEAPSEPPVADRQAGPSSVGAPPSAVNLGEIPVTGSRDSRARDERTSCVAGFLPEGSLGEQAALEWLCSEADATAGAARLREATKSSKDRDRGNLDLGWYWIPVFAMVQQGCCSESGPLKLPESSPSCPSGSQALHELTRHVASFEPVAEPLDRFTEALECQTRAGRARRLSGALGLREGPRAEAREAFLAIVKRLGQP